MTVGDARWQRKHYPMYWFIAANHRMALERLLGRKSLTRLPATLSEVC